MTKEVDYNQDLPPVDFTQVTTTSGESVREVRAQQAQDKEGMHKSYIVLTKEERSKGFVRPVRRSYRHVGILGPTHPIRDLTRDEVERFGDSFDKFEAYGEPDETFTGKFWTNEQLAKVGKGCGVVTTMGVSIAETYARIPHYYGQTFCVGCNAHIPVGKDGEFVWDRTNERVGT